MASERVKLVDIRERADLVRGLNASPVTAAAIADRESMLAALDAVLAVCDEYSPTASSNPMSPDALRRAARYAVSARIRAAIESVIDLGGDGRG